MGKIVVSATHIKIQPYTLGDCREIERDFSVWVKAEFRVNYIGCYYDESLHALYLPSGANLVKIKHFFPSYNIENESPNRYRYCDAFEVTSEPRGQIQENAINFLTAKDRFYSNMNNPQLALNLDTGDGKTFCTISAISKFRLKAIIITHKKHLKEQWVDEFTSKSNIDPNRVIDIVSTSQIMKMMDMDPKELFTSDMDIFIVTHQTLANFAKISGSWDNINILFMRLGIGIKVYDECHKFFHNSLMIDFYTNVYKTFYLTATFGRSDRAEVAVFRRAYSSLAKFGDETFSYDEKIKHTTVIIIYFRSGADLITARKLKTNRGFSNYRYIKYAIEEENQTLLRVLKRIIDKCDNDIPSGRTLIASPTIESLEYFADEIRKMTNRSVSTYHSKIDKEEKQLAYTADYICSTIKSTAEGDNIPELRKLILLDVVSPLLMDQFRGRLRKYKDGVPTYMFCPVDCSIPDVKRIFDRSIPMFKKKCKQIVTLNMNDL